MAIYIEYVIIDNVVMDYIIISFMELTLGRKFGRWNKVLLLILASISALVLPVLIEYKLLAFLYKIITSIILTLCIQRYKKLKQFLLNYLMFFAYTAFVGGVCLALIQLLGIEYTMSSVVMYNFDFPVGVFGLLLLFVVRIMNKVIRVSKDKIRQCNCMHKIKLVDMGNCVQGYGFLDTGNNIKYNGGGVSIISIDLFLKLYKNIKIQDVLMCKTDNLNLKGCECIYIRGIGNMEKYLSFVLDYIEVDNIRIDNPRLAITLKSFSEYDVILSNEFLRSGM